MTGSRRLRKYYQGWKNAIVRLPPLLQIWLTYSTIAVSAHPFLKFIRYRVRLQEIRLSGAHQFYTQNVQFTSDPCDIIATWLYQEYEVLAVDSDDKPIAIVYGCGNAAKFADDSTRKYSSCDVTGYWSPPIEECQGKFINCIYRAYFITIML